MKRRSFLKLCPALSLLSSPASAASAPSLTLGYNTYGTQALSTADAIDAIAKTGFDTLELSLMPGWDTDPKTLTKQKAADLRSRIADSGLRLTAFLEHLRGATNPDANPADDLERLERAIDLAHDFSSEHPPLIESALGGKLSWDKTRDLLLRRLPAWQKLAEENKVVVAIKPHRGAGMTRPEHAIDVINELGNSPWLRINWDYSHYAFRDPPLPLVETIEKSAAHTALVTVKDTVLEPDGRARFRLPGESGNIDYPLLLKTFHAAGYRGDVQCEVSAQLWKQPGFDPLPAMQTCYTNMARAFEEAAIPRPRD